ncbi:MAG: hypothetical protein Kilf2KO_10360 [Rhodospirillales bacterium]
MKITVSALALACLVALAACGESDDETSSSDSESAPAVADSAGSDSTSDGQPLSASAAADKIVSELGVIADQLETVTSEESAKAAAVVIEKSNQALQEVSETFSELSTVSKAAAIAAVAQHLGDVQKRIADAMQKIQADNPQLFQTLSETIDQLPSLN